MAAGVLFSGSEIESPCRKITRITATWKVLRVIPTGGCCHHAGFYS